MSKTREALLAAEKAISDCLTYKSHLGHRALDQVRAALSAPDESAELREALTGLVEIIDKAGLINLMNGVQLGQTSWYVKASDAMDRARALTKSGGE